MEVKEATVSLIAFEAGLEGGTADENGERRRLVAGYNEDDCRATLALRDWLEGRRVELAERLGQELPRPVFAEQPGAAQDPETARIRSALLAGVSRKRLAQLRGTFPRKRPRGRPGAAGRAARLAPARGQAGLVAVLLPPPLTPAELTGEPDALGGLVGGELVGRVRKPVVRAPPLPAAGAQGLGRRGR